VCVSSDGADGDAGGVAMELAGFAASDGFLRRCHGQTDGRAVFFCASSRTFSLLVLALFNASRF
jgi:hypothetical protein